MAAIKISSKVDEDVWNELCGLAHDTHQDVASLLTEAIREYLQRRNVRRAEVLAHLKQSIERNRRLAELLGS